MDVNSIEEVLKFLKSTKATDVRKNPVNGKMELTQTVRIDSKYSIV